MVEHQLHADFPERLALLGVGQAQGVGRLGQYLGGDVADIGPRVPVLGVGSPFAAAISELTNRSIWAPWSLK